MLGPEKKNKKKCNANDLDATHAHGKLAITRLQHIVSCGSMAIAEVRAEEERAALAAGECQRYFLWETATKVS